MDVLIVKSTGTWPGRVITGTHRVIVLINGFEEEICVCEQCVFVHSIRIHPLNKFFKRLYGV